jgi:hypothetical protein
MPFRYYEMEHYVLTIIIVSSDWSITLGNIVYLSSFSSCYYGDALYSVHNLYEAWTCSAFWTQQKEPTNFCCYSTSRVQMRVHLSSLCQLVYSRGYITDRIESWIEPVNAIGLCSIANEIRSNPILLVTCTWLEHVNVSVVKCLCLEFQQCSNI